MERGLFSLSMGSLQFQVAPQLKAVVITIVGLVILGCSPKLDWRAAMDAG